MDDNINHLHLNEETAQYMRPLNISIETLERNLENAADDTYYPAWNTPSSVIWLPHTTFTLISSRLCREGTLDSTPFSSMPPETETSRRCCPIVRSPSNDSLFSNAHSSALSSKHKLAVPQSRMVSRRRSGHVVSAQRLGHHLLSRSPLFRSPCPATQRRSGGSS